MPLETVGSALRQEGFMEMETLNMGFEEWLS